MLAAAAAYNTVLTPMPMVIGEEGMEVLRAVLESAAAVRQGMFCGGREGERGMGEERREGKECGCVWGWLR